MRPWTLLTWLAVFALLQQLPAAQADAVVCGGDVCDVNASCMDTECQCDDGYEGNGLDCVAIAVALPENGGPDTPVTIPDQAPLPDPSEDTTTLEPPPETTTTTATPQPTPSPPEDTTTLEPPPETTTTTAIPRPTPSPSEDPTVGPPLPSTTELPTETLTTVMPVPTATEQPDPCLALECDVNAQCRVQANGTAQCRCITGYTGSGLVGGCTVVVDDPCATQPCDANAACAAANGTFTCTCAAGYYGSGLLCSPCTSTCSSGFFKSGTCGPTSDITCEQCTTVAEAPCAPGEYRPKCTGTETVDAQCTRCQAMDVCIGAAQYVAKCTGRSDSDTGVCSLCTICAATQYAKVGCNSTSDAVCAECSQDFAHCQACTSAGCTSCAVGYYTAANGSCAECASGLPATSHCDTSAPITCTTGSDIMCMRCLPGYSGDQCDQGSGCSADTQPHCEQCTAGLCESCLYGFTDTAQTCNNGCGVGATAVEFCEQHNCTVETAAGVGLPNCDLCKAGYYRKAVSTPGTYSCAACVQQCQAGQYVSNACAGNTTSDKSKCRSCKTTDCGKGMYIAGCNGSSTADTGVCMACKTTCGVGQQLTGECTGREYDDVTTCSGAVTEAQMTVRLTTACDIWQADYESNAQAFESTLAQSGVVSVQVLSSQCVGARRRRQQTTTELTVGGTKADLATLADMVARGDAVAAGLGIASVEMDGTVTVLGSASGGSGTGGLSTGAIIGIAVGAVLLLAAAIATFVLVRRRRSRGLHVQAPLSSEAHLAPMARDDSSSSRDVSPVPAALPTKPVQVSGLSTPSTPPVAAPRPPPRAAAERADANNIVKLSVLGSGAFGTVRRGRMTRTDGTHIMVALKELRQEGPSTDKVLAEANLMNKLSHANIVSCLGAFPDPDGPNIVIVMELMGLGDLREYLISKTDVALAERSWFAYNIAKGMQYLASKGIVHRDLAARNCMLGDPTPASFGYPVVKVSDFGLARTVIEDKQYYAQHGGDRMPVRWMAPESLATLKYTQASDVWSYGVTLWEIFTNGEIPYKDTEVFAILRNLSDGQRLPQPATAPDSYYKVCTDCWAYEPPQRPSFVQLAFVTAHLFVRDSHLSIHVQDKFGEPMLAPGPDPNPAMHDPGTYVDVYATPTHPSYFSFHSDS